MSAVKVWDIGKHIHANWHA